jgi:hypothetical protein
MEVHSMYDCDFFEVHSFCWGRGIVITRPRHKKAQLRHCMYVCMWHMYNNSVRLSVPTYSYKTRRHRKQNGNANVRAGGHAHTHKYLRQCQKKHSFLFRKFGTTLPAQPNSSFAQETQTSAVPRTGGRYDGVYRAEGTHRTRKTQTSATAGTWQNLTVFCAVQMFNTPIHIKAPCICLTLQNFVNIYC